MIKAFFEDGKTIEAKDYNELVEILANQTQQNVTEYMEGAARRCKIWDGSEIVYSNTDEFVSEFLRVGVIKKILIS